MMEHNHKNPSNEQSKNGKHRKILLLIVSGIAVIAIVGAIVYAILSQNRCNASSEGFYAENLPEKSNLVDKPILYLYPQTETDVTVCLGNPQNLTCSYPLYQSSGWMVRANADGELVDLQTGRSLYALYYESTAVTDFAIEPEGFVVKGINTVAFLEQALAALGLTEREAEEFILYWLPALQKNEYNYIRFTSADEINENMPLSITPTPDTVIRVWMTYKGLHEPITVTAQELTAPERDGFTVVEWGGTEILN